MDVEVGERAARRHADNRIIPGKLYGREQESISAGGTDGAYPLFVSGDALISILPWQVVCYGIVAALMLLLQRRAVSPQE